MHQQLNLTMCPITVFDNPIHIPIMFWCFGNRIFRCEHGPCTTSHQRNFAAKGMTTNHKIRRRCHSSVREPWIEIESLESGHKHPSFQLFVIGDLQDTPISQCFGMLLSYTNPASQVTAEHQATSPKRPWHRIPSYEVKNLRGQLEQLAGQ